MKSGLLAAVVVLAIALSAVGLSFTRPAEISSSQQVKLLDYQQTGQFNYKVVSRPSSLYDSAVPKTPDPIPTAAIQSFTLSFRYTSPNPAGGPIRISALLENAGNWKKTVPVSTGNQTAAQAVSFPLDLKAYQDMADAINKEIGTSSSSYDITIQALVPGGATSLEGQSTDFVQSLAIKMNKTFVRVGDTLDLSQGGTQGRFDYQVQLGDNLLYGPVTLASPPAPAYCAGHPRPEGYGIRQADRRHDHGLLLPPVVQYHAAPVPGPGEDRSRGCQRRQVVQDLHPGANHIEDRRSHRLLPHRPQTVRRRLRHHTAGDWTYCLKRGPDADGHGARDRCR